MKVDLQTSDNSFLVFENKYLLDIIKMLRAHIKIMEENRIRKLEFEKYIKKLEEKEAIRTIDRLSSFLMKYRIISAANSITKFLTHSSSKVRQHAAAALSHVIKIGLIYVRLETNESVKNQLLYDLTGIADTLDRMSSYGEIKKDIAGQINHIISLCRNADQCSQNIFFNKSKSKTTSKDSIHEDELTSISKIINLIQALNKYNCISSSETLIKYIDHSKESVRDCASEAIIICTQKASEELQKDNDQSFKKELVSGLISISNQLNGKLVNRKVTSDISHKVETAIKIADITHINEGLEIYDSIVRLAKNSQNIKI